MDLKNAGDGLKNRVCAEGGDSAPILIVTSDCRDMEYSDQKIN